ncbi:hypothetical protein CRUP_003629 [Coryphaenoides rupestris]|nr:hypothetical protein CRUP_003629 [Coryphaenoides rupestris]
MLNGGLSCYNTRRRFGLIFFGGWLAPPPESPCWVLGAWLRGCWVLGALCWLGLFQQQQQQQQRTVRRAGGSSSHATIRALRVNWSGTSPQQRAALKAAAPTDEPLRRNTASVLCCRLLLLPPPPPPPGAAVLFLDLWSRSLCHLMEQLVDVGQEHPSAGMGYVYHPACLLRISPIEKTWRYVGLSFTEHLQCECRPRPKSRINDRCQEGND